MSKDDWVKSAALLVASFVALFLAWEIVVVALQVIGPVMSLLTTLITWLLVIVVGALSTLVTIAALIGIWMLVVAVVQRAVTQIKDMFDCANKAAVDAAVDAAVLAILAGVIGLLAYLSTGDFLKGHELSLVKATAISSMAIILLKIALYTNLRVVRFAVWPLLVLCYIAPFAFGAYYVTNACHSRASFACLMEFHDDLDEVADGTSPLRQAAPSPIAMATLSPSAAVASQKEPLAQPAAKPPLLRALKASEASNQAGEPDPRKALRVHSMLIAGHVLIFALALFTMLFPFAPQAWKRLLGLAQA